MAVSRLQDKWGYNKDWFWVHKLGEHMALLMNYAVYADMSSTTAQPYITLSGCSVHSLRNQAYWLSPHLPLTIKLHINDEEKIYTFSTGTAMKNKETDILVLDEATPSGGGGSISGDTVGYYYVDFSSSTHILIPKNGEEFTITLEITTHDGDTYTFTEYEAAPVPVVITGPSQIQTGTVATFSLSTQLINNKKFKPSGYYSYYFASLGSSSWSNELFVSPYVPMSDCHTYFSEVQLLAHAHGATEGEKSKVSASGNDLLEITYAYRIPVKTPVFTDVYQYYGYGGSSRNVRVFWEMPETHCVTYVTKNVQAVAKRAYDESLRQEIKSLIYNNYYYKQQLDRYGGAVQGRAHYSVSVDCQGYRDERSGNDLLKYGSQFYEQHVREYTTGAMVESKKAGYSASFGASIYDLLTPVTNAPVEMWAFDNFGFETSYTDYVTVIPYHAPRLPLFRARRCSPVSAGTDGEVYVYDGVVYQPDDYGEYALIEWEADFSPLNNLNAMSLHISVPSRTSETGYVDTAIDLPEYTSSGYLVAPADPERSYDVVFTMTDDFHGTKAPPWVEDSWAVSMLDGSRTYIGLYSPPAVYTYPLNTALAMIDFKHGGTGVALGKVSELDQVFDIHRNWLLKMPDATMIQEYNADKTAVRMCTWMNRCMSRMQAINDAKPWGIYGERYLRGHGWFEGYTPALIPDGYGEVYTGGNYRCMMVVPNTDRVVGITHIEPFTVNRNYLNVRFDPSYSFRGQGFNNATYTPMIYLCSTRPTTIDQSTGRPNATIVDYQQITTAYARVGSNDDGYTYWRCERGSSLDPSSGWTGFDTGILHSFNVASRKGQQLWVVVTCRQGGNSQSGYYHYRSAQLNLYDIVLSNSRANYEHY